MTKTLFAISSLWRRQLVKDAFALYFGKGLSLTIGILSTLAYGIVFASREIATISLFAMVSGVVVSFGFKWSAFGIVRFGKEEYLRDRRLNYTSSLRLSIVLPLLAVVIMLILTFRDSLLLYIGSDDPSVISFLVAEIILVVFHEHLSHIFTALERHAYNVFFYTAQSLGKICTLTGFYLGLFGVSAELYLKLQTTLLLLLLIFRLPFLEKGFLFPLTRVRKDDLRRFSRFVTPQIYGFAGLYLINWMDVYFIRKYGTFDQLGAYQFLYSIFLKVSSFAFILNALFFPKIVAWKEHHASKVEQYLRYAPTIVFVAACFAVVAALAIYQPLFQTFFGAKYLAAYPSFNILLCALPFFFVTYLLVPVLNGYDRVGYIQSVNIVSALANLVIDLIFIKRFGLVAAAVGTFVAYFAKCLLLMVAVSGMFKIRYRTLAVSSIVLSLIAAVYAI